MTDQSEIIVGRGGTCFAGPDAVQLFRAATLRSALGLLKVGIIPTRGLTKTKALAMVTQYTGQTYKRGEFDRAMKDLQGKFLALKVEEHYEPFTYVWDTLEHRWPDALKESRALSKNEAAYRVLRRYFEIAGFGNERALGRILQIEAALVDGAARRLEREKIIARATRIEGASGSYSILRALI